MDTSGTTAERHVPVLAHRCLELLRPALADGGTLVDATLGLGGHSELVLTALPAAHVVGIDRDAEAIALAGERLAPFGDRFRAVHTTYDRIGEVSGGAVDAVLMDLGVSSLQLDEAGRGFAYAKDAPLDMRMDVTAGEGAAAFLARADEAELRTILYRWGEERFAPRIAREIVRSRAITPIERTGQLVEIVRRSIPAAARRHGGNPAKRTFQAIRIAVNREMDILAAAVPAAIDALRPGGRIVVLAYHSLEDRIVKQEFHRRSTSSAPPGMPELDEHRPTLRLLTRGAEKADETEIAANPRSASVRLRAAERIRENP
ncbi:MAG: 16S rRNA (cytosine(1402)-N(4))-methyltransferase RsmH [Actinomycetes bacterium]|nr:16S rRNA (cytosine(1402)-N(4))-methyltransferase RsmH [Actinomycetes bacterium]MDX5380785.1 16S rRNA (cytosine(1402)-N(4))-methyltransferase RsmH [Actinomycetes bacterium]MDX5399812.1 16S rRNA (cytosine(1402)-N(4))-methyltransferase RsmH [Actinomycetes bacterium]MDX5450525.1 16S rRNA (cytosine(1402)-N(4))-methyltransferase RsmH [Actinomycetes bacterium]